MTKERIAKAIINMEEEALSARNEKLYRETIGFIKGLRLCGAFKPEFEGLLLNEFREEWRNRRETMGERFRRMWSMTS